MFFGIVLMFVAKDFVRDCFVAQIYAPKCACARRNSRISARGSASDAEQNPSILGLGYEHWNYPKEHVSVAKFKFSRHTRISGARAVSG